MSATCSWSAPRKRFRILDVQPPSLEGNKADITAYWTVEEV
jgi:hypothetical protein